MPIFRVFSFKQVNISKTYFSTRDSGHGYNTKHISSLHAKSFSYTESNKTTN